MPPQHWRHLWFNAPRHGIHTFWWPAIRSDSYVLITVAEAALPQPPVFVMPVDRFIGDAAKMQATNVAPFHGGVAFRLHWDTLIPSGNFPYLNVWTDITVFDPNDPSGQN